MSLVVVMPDQAEWRARSVTALREAGFSERLIRVLEDGQADQTTMSESHPLQFPLLASNQPGHYDLKPEAIADLLVREELLAYETVNRRHPL